MQILVLFEHIVFSIYTVFGPRWGVRGLAAGSSTSNRANSKLFKYQKKVELCYGYTYSTVASDAGYLYR